jgi:hypothetical protein
MIRLFPFSKWPLHVELFTEEAACYWVALASTSPSSPFYVSSSDSKCSRQFGHELLRQRADKNDEMLFPPGFTFSIGLNGPKKLPRSRRKGPLRVTDGKPIPCETRRLLWICFTSISFTIGPRVAGGLKSKPWFKFVLDPGRCYSGSIPPQLSNFATSSYINSFSINGNNYSKCPPRIRVSDVTTTIMLIIG